MNCNPLGSSVDGISQATILQWVAISFSRWSSRFRNWTLISCIGRQILHHWVNREVQSYIEKNSKDCTHTHKNGSVQSLSHVRLFVTPWIAARQACLSITNSRSLPKPMPIELVMPSSHLILGHPLFFPQSLPASGSFPMNQLFTWGGQSTGVSASASVLPMNTQDWSPLGWTGWISLQYKGLSRVL